MSLLRIPDSETGGRAQNMRELTGEVGIEMLDEDARYARLGG
jgi:hypothetical protein